MVKILCTGDIHIGRRSSRTKGTYRTVDAWNAVVERAITERVDVLAISGDVIDQAAASYESIGPMADGLARLGVAGIETVAVAGNHDFEVLPRVARMPGMEQFHLIGQRDQWARYTVLRDGLPLLHVDGWSFPTMNVPQQPMLKYPPRSRDGVPVLGLVHVDLGTATSTYAPATLGQFLPHEVDLWLLGHIHVPRLYPMTGAGGVLYPGSPFAMDLGEQGPHGIWIAELAAGTTSAPVLHPISPVHYAMLEIDLSEVVDEDGFQRAVFPRLQDTAREARRDAEEALREVIVRVRLTGTSSAYRFISHWADLLLEDDSFPVDQVNVLLESCISHVRPPIDLVDLANGNSPLAETARLILGLTGDDPDSSYADLIRETEADLDRIARASDFAQLPVDEPDAKVAQALLLAQSWNLLIGLLVTKEAA